MAKPETQEELEELMRSFREDPLISGEIVELTDYEGFRVRMLVQIGRAEDDLDVTSVAILAAWFVINADHATLDRLNRYLGPEEGDEEGDEISH
jgi:hypothetical protein